MANNEELRRKEIYRNILGNADPDSPEGLLKQALADTYKQLGDPKRASELAEKAADLRRL